MTTAIAVVATCGVPDDVAAAEADTDDGDDCKRAAFPIAPAQRRDPRRDYPRVGTSPITPISDLLDNLSAHKTPQGAKTGSSATVASTCTSRPRTGPG